MHRADDRARMDSSHGPGAPIAGLDETCLLFLLEADCPVIVRSPWPSDRKVFRITGLVDDLRFTGLLGRLGCRAVTGLTACWPPRRARLPVGVGLAAARPG